PSGGRRNGPFPAVEPTRPTWRSRTLTAIVDRRPNRQNRRFPKRRFGSLWRGRRSDRPARRRPSRRFIGRAKGETFDARRDPRRNAKAFIGRVAGQFGRLL